MPRRIAMASGPMGSTTARARRSNPACERDTGPAARGGAGAAIDCLLAFGAMPLILARARTHQPGPADRASQEVFPVLLGADTQDIRPGPSHHGDMTDEPATRPGAPGRTRRVLAIALFALALAGCLTAITVALASGMSFSAAVNAYTVTDGAMA